MLRVVKVAIGDLSAEILPGHILRNESVQGIYAVVYPCLEAYKR
jgi:hypothetical protein